MVSLCKLVVFFSNLADLRPKGRGRPQRILLGQWPEDHVRQVIRAVVFRDGSLAYSGPSPRPPTRPTTPTYASSSSSSTEARRQAVPGISVIPGREGSPNSLQAQLKTFYDNPLASQLLAASSKVYQQQDGAVRSYQDAFKQELADGAFDDADNIEEDDENLVNETEKKDGGSPTLKICKDNISGGQQKSIDAIVNRLTVTAVQDPRSETLEALAINPDIILTELNGEQGNHSITNSSTLAEKENRGGGVGEERCSEWKGGRVDKLTIERKFVSPVSQHGPPEFGKMMDE